MKAVWMAGLFAVVLSASIACGGVIVPSLDDSTAIAAYTAARNGTVINEVADITTGKITLAARFNPDISQAEAGPVLVIEDGGTSNGTGLYLAGGNLVFVAKADNGRYAVPTGLNDTDFANDGTGKSIAVLLGPVNFGAENKVYVSMDLVNGLLYASINGAGNSYGITNSTGAENLDGNRSVSFLGVDPIPADQYGWLGGLLEENATNQASTLYPQLFWTNTVPMIQTAGYDNPLGQIFAVYVPEPASLALVGLGSWLVRSRRRA